MNFQWHSSSTNQRPVNGVRFLVLAILLVTLGACSPKHKKSADSPHTGNPDIESETAPNPILNQEIQANSQGSGQAIHQSADQSTHQPGETSPPSTDEASEPTPVPETGEPIDHQTPAPPSPTKAVDNVVGTVAYVYSERIRARSSAEITDDNIVGVLELNDPVEILNEKTERGFAQVRVVQERGSLTAGQIVFVASKYLNKTPRVLSLTEEAAQGIFMVQNIATEKARIYRRCKPDEGCVNRLLAEINTVNGEDKNGTRTSLGSYRITKWEKFYEDKARLYPAWYRPHYPPVPKPNVSRAAWFDDDYMPNGSGDARGAFGWYTAIVGPNAHSQWTHGTLGWGADGEAFIDYKNTFWGVLLNLFTSIRSHGCTRMSNPAVAYVREVLPAGASLIKIYARETYRDERRTAYQAVKDEHKWYYFILTITGYGKAGGLGPDRYKVLAENIPQKDWLEEGAYYLDQYPNAKDQNLYDIDGDDFKGVYNVDEGTVSRDYRHPRELGRGGYSDQLVPSYMIAR